VFSGIHFISNPSQQQAYACIIMTFQNVVDFTDAQFLKTARSADAELTYHKSDNKMVAFPENSSRAGNDEGMSTIARAGH
jgi:hypothetical protein